MSPSTTIHLKRELLRRSSRVADMGGKMHYFEWAGRFEGTKNNQATSEVSLLPVKYYNHCPPEMDESKDNRCESAFQGFSTSSGLLEQTGESRCCAVHLPRSNCSPTKSAHSSTPDVDDRNLGGHRRSKDCLRPRGLELIALAYTLLLGRSEKIDHAPQFTTLQRDTAGKCTQQSEQCFVHFNANICWRRAGVTPKVSTAQVQSKRAHDIRVYRNSNDTRRAPHHSQ